MYVPRTECPMVPAHCVGKIARLSTCQVVIQEAVGVESKSIRGYVISIELNRIKLS